MKGLELADRYYREVGRPLLEQRIPEILPQLAAGLVGEGSECLGFDDELSRDHDFGPGFCLWLEDEAYERFGPRLEALYRELPGEFAGFPARQEEPRAGKRVGVFRIYGFYSRFLGRLQPPETPAEWLAIPEYCLAAASNGRVFEDGPGSFSRIRDALLAYYPEPVRIRKIAENVHLLSQSGQYNYARCLKRADPAAARLCADEFLRAALHLAHLLDKRYEPYYKWAWQSFRELPLSEVLAPPLEKLTRLPAEDGTVPGLMEEICCLFLPELRRQELTEGPEDFLDVHAGRIAAKLSRFR